MSGVCSTFIFASVHVPQLGSLMNILEKIHLSYDFFFWPLAADVEDGLLAEY